MLTHDQIWGAIDALAKRKAHSVSALAKLAGLDATTFNRSKRVSADGHPRWPSTESIAKILAATGTGVDEFLGLIAHASAQPVALVPFRSMQAGEAGFDGELCPAGKAWDAIPAPATNIRGVFAFAVEGDAGTPAYRRGDILIASAHADMRVGDRLALIGRDGVIRLAVLAPSTAQNLNTTTLQGSPLPAEPRSAFALVARILWASQ
jgi:phage repressor protein C with HTH and peptisase S24 domain